VVTSWQTPRSLSIWALVDIARHNTHDSTQQSASQHILDLAGRTSPPHKPLQDGEFRLLRIHAGHEDDVLDCNISNHPLENMAKEYCALSYCWGPQSQPQKILFLNGRATFVGESLFVCLSQFRQVRRLVSKCHWLGALCIRQDNLQEKNLQIPLMGRIYSAAPFVNIWLGPDEDDSGYVLDRLDEADMNAAKDPRFTRGFECLLRRPWFG
jgi:hypothetical protein